MTKQLRPFIFGFFCLFLMNTTQAENISIPEIHADTSSEDEFSFVSTNPKTDCPKKAKNCKGQRIWEDGNKYEGEFKYGEPHGWGTFHWPDRTMYIGEFVDGLRHGHGQQTFSNGDTYAGEWRFGHMHGKGVYDWVDDSKYVGTFVKGHMEGKGIITLPNGESYDGEWKSGLAEGNGEYVKEDGSKHVGHYKDGKRSGTGVITWRTGDVFVGKWKGGQINKKGTFHFNNGDKYFCTWSEGELNGDGTYMFYNGRELNGDPLTIERAINDDEELKENIAPNLGLTWYTIGMEYMHANKFDKAKENFEMARKYVPKSSDLNKLIHKQMQKIKKEMPEGS